LSERVCAVVVTFNRQQLLRECLAALSAQTRAVDEILVVNNASTDGTLEMLAAEFPRVSIVNLPENGGGAGGFYEGVKAAYERGFEWLWLMDDDGRAAPDCLEKLCEQRRPRSVLVPIQQDTLQSCYGIFEWTGRARNVTPQIIEGKRAVTGDFLFAFVGPLISREVIAEVGFPNKDFFIWFDDWEYALRIQRTTAEIVAVPEAMFFHDFGKAKRIRFLWQLRQRNEVPPWKCYYGTRNPLYVLLRGERPRSELLRYFIKELQHLVGDIIYEPQRWKYVRMHLKGMLDGATGRLGKRVLPG
jgi:rhamnopyranosyl-N-acetylglucosaminyl-diphospho-decaprenol beta-1,3/1,4-galactofuranosyltransferase